MHTNKDRTIVKWVDLAVLKGSHEGSGIAEVCPMEFDDRQRCFGVTLDHHWLCGSDGALTFFDSLLAASRFLRLLDVDHQAMDGCNDCAVSDNQAFQCFQLGAQGGLTACNKCHIGDVCNSKSVREEARWDDRW